MVMGAVFPLSALFAELWEHYWSGAARLLARVGIDGMVALRGLALRLGLSYADGLSLMDYLGDNAAHMDWFVDVVRWVAGAQVDGQGEHYVGLGVEVCRLSCWVRHGIPVGR